MSAKARNLKQLLMFETQKSDKAPILNQVSQNKDMRQTEKEETKRSGSESPIRYGIYKQFTREVKKNHSNISANS